MITVTHLTLLLALVVGTVPTLLAEEAAVSEAAKDKAEIALVKKQHDTAVKDLASCRLELRKAQLEIAALREQNQTLSNALELTRQELQEARKAAGTSAK